jgi:hypothetical protein
MVHYPPSRQQTTLNGIGQAVQVSDNVMLRDCWKSHDIMKGISNTSVAWNEVSELCVNGRF